MVWLLRCFPRILLVLMECSKGGDVLEAEVKYDCTVKVQYVADYYKGTKQAVRNWIKAGLPHVKRGNILRFAMYEVKR